MVDIWHQVSFMILVLLAGLVSLPREVYEAASIDGASPMQRFYHITLPLMKPVIVVALLLRTIFGFRTFDLVYVLTRGGPGVTTDMTSYFIYRHTFMSLNIAEASAASYIFLLFNMVVVVFLYRSLRRREEG
jgi:multiple sugar transport system permease protein